MVCTFLGHRECYGLEAGVLEGEIEKLILAGADTFYVGHQGDFDRMVLGCLAKLCDRYPHISYAVVLAYLPTEGGGDAYHGCTIYPEGMESVLPRFAIEKRNKWMIDRADCCLCYITHKWGGAYKFVMRAKKKGLILINLGDTDLD